MATWSEIKAEIQTEYDLSEEVFVNADELMTYANQGLEELGREIHVINDNYFSAEAPLALTAGSDEYSLPTNIYANKINLIWYNSGGSPTAIGSVAYEIKPLKKLTDIASVGPSSLYKYRIKNNTIPKLKFYPASLETSSTNVTIFYRREVSLFTADTDLLDIPEAKQFIKQYVVEKAKNKEAMTPDAPPSDRLSYMKKTLLDSLEHMIDDDNNEVEINMDHYEESV